jgi:hypothetical protein
MQKLLEILAKEQSRIKIEEPDAELVLEHTNNKIR